MSLIDFVKKIKHFLNSKVVLSIYPVYLSLVALFPFFVGYFVNPVLISINQIIVLFLWITIFNASAFFTKKSVFYYSVVVLIFVNGFVNLGHWVMVKTPITATGLFVLFNTNFQEAAGFALTKWSYMYLLYIPYFFLFYLSLRNAPRFSEKNRSVSDYVLPSFLTIAVVGAIVFLIAQKKFLTHATPDLVSTVISYNRELKDYKALKNELDIRLERIDAEASLKNEKQTVVLIMGESTNRNHMSLYGNTVQTNPKLEQFEDLIVYEDVISGYAHTMTSVPASLTAANLENGMGFAQSTTLAEVFRGAGFKTFWLSNQSPFGVWDNLITLFAEQYEYLAFINVTGNSSHEVLKRNSYDERLLQPLKDALDDDEDKKFIVLHLLGTHLQYEMRYPNEFDVYRDGSSWKNKCIARYRNAVLYNDFVVDSILKMVRAYSEKNNTIASVIYVSDHGENVFDYGDYVGHDYADYMPKCLVEIPFITWLSPAYERAFKERAASVKNNYQLPFVTDDLFHTLIDLANIKTSVHEPERSVFNPLYNKDRKRILVDGEDYDAKIE